MILGRARADRFAGLCGPKPRRAGLDRFHRLGPGLRPPAEICDIGPRCRRTRAAAGARLGDAVARGEGVHEFKKGPEPFLAGGRRLGGKRIATGDSDRRLGPGFYLASHRHGASSAARVAVGPAALCATRPLCRALRKGHCRWRCCGGARRAGPRSSLPPPRGKFLRLAGAIKKCMDSRS